MGIVAENSTTLNDVMANSAAWDIVARRSVAWTALAENLTAWAAVMASSTAFDAAVASKAALSAIWGSESALSAIRANQSAVDKLVSSSYTTSINKAPSTATGVQVAGKCILLKSKNDSGTDTNTVATKYSNGASVGNFVYGTTQSFSNQVIAFVDFKHISSTSNRTWTGYVIDCD